MKRLNRIVSAMAAGVLLFGMILYAPAAAAGVRDGLRIAAETALPALFPFFVAGSLMVRTGLSAAVGRVMARPFHYLYGLPGAGASALALGLLGGYPVGVQVTVQMFQAGQLERAEAERLLGFVNCSGPAFLVGMCGAAVCGSVQAGFLLYAVHVAAAYDRLCNDPFSGCAAAASQASPSGTIHTGLCCGSRRRDGNCAKSNLFCRVFCRPAICGGGAWRAGYFCRSVGPPASDCRIAGARFQRLFCRTGGTDKRFGRASCIRIACPRTVSADECIGRVWRIVRALPDA